MAPLLLPLLLLLSSVSLQAQQNITLGSSMTPEGPSSYWLSPSGDFAFGFQPIEGNTSSYLLAVWFNKINDKTVAWYARTSSPEPSPVPVSSGSRLQLTSGGTLSLLNHTSSEVWTPQFVGAAAYARMLDSGNFVLAAADGSTKWGTFNNPADTILLTQELNAPNLQTHSTAGSSPQTTPMVGSSLTCKIQVLHLIPLLCRLETNMTPIGPFLAILQRWCLILWAEYILPWIMAHKSI
jgi:hypothetical protein